MCGRMTLTRSGSEIAEYFALEMDAEAITDFDGGPLRTRYNVAPSQLIPTIVATEPGARTLAWKQWGLVPFWSKSPTIAARLFNARSETAHEKPSFRAAWKRRRCLVVADGFYEWTPRNRGHQPYHLRPRADALLGFAGLFEEWQGEGGEVIESCTVLTTDANPDLEGIHHRMPVILEKSAFTTWLDPASDPAELRALMQPAAAGTLEACAVDPRVNDARFDDPQCLDPPIDESAPIASESAQHELFPSDGEGG
jgi:putative SOS response-associated peptidase YedK